MKPQDVIKEKSNLWIFGYGSLVWKPDFAYKRSKVGHITGYKRRFWHGDDFYRGNKEKVRSGATLAPNTPFIAHQLVQTFSDGFMILFSHYFLRIVLK